MATYNGERYLPEQLESIAQQTLLPDELVVCDDQSSDSTRAVVEDFGQTAPFPVYFHENPQRLHFADNFLEAAARCRGDYVAFCDQDDVWLPEKLERVGAAFDRTGAALVAHQALSFTEGSDREERFQFAHHGILLPDDLFPWHFFFGFACTFRRDLLDVSPSALRPFDVIDPRRRLAHDRWITFLATTRGIVVVLPDELARYRQHDTNESGWMRSGRSAGAAYSAARNRFAYNLAKHLSAARRFIEILEEQVAKQGNADRSDLDRLLDRWRELDEAYRARLAIAEEDTRAGRLKRWGEAMKRGAYRPSVAERPLPMSARELALAFIARPGQRGLAKSMLSQAGYPE
ncbi:glycosyltransferase family 2 protein [Actinomycetospora rhizophila]|uniref:Glycosyltransferase family 2 protein n=1 Tax=Actinomycetospora rhizophila TaxID=1416876 RepID=A0ABV9ZKN9_9PSEU